MMCALLLLPLMVFGALVVAVVGVWGLLVVVRAKKAGAAALWAEGLAVKGFFVQLQTCSLYINGCNLQTCSLYINGLCRGAICQHVVCSCCAA